MYCQKHWLIRIVSSSGKELLFAHASLTEEKYVNFAFLKTFLEIRIEIMFENQFDLISVVQTR